MDPHIDYAIRQLSDTTTRLDIELNGLSTGLAAMGQMARERTEQLSAENEYLRNQVRILMARLNTLEARL